MEKLGLNKKSSKLRLDLTLLMLCIQVSKKHVKKEVSKQIHEKAAPFVTWLRTAEEESSEEEDGEDDVEVVYSDKQSGPSLTAQPEPTQQVSGL